MTVVILAVVATMSTSVSAYTNKDLMNYVNSSHNINNMVFELSNDQKQEITNYLKDNPVSDDIANSIKSDIDAIETKIKETGATDVSQISPNVKAEVTSIVQSAGSKAGLNVSVNSNAKTVTVATKVALLMIHHHIFQERVEV